MVSFVESATLRLNDDSSKKIRAVNAALSQLFATSRKMKSMRIDIKGLDKAPSQVRKLTAEMQKLQKAQSAIKRLSGTIKINDSAVDRALNKVTTLRRMLNQLSSNVRVNVSGRVPTQPPMAPGPPQRPPRVPPVTVNVAPLNSLLNGFISRLGYTIESAIIRGFRQGTSAIDVAETRLGLQGLPPEQRSFANDVAKGLSRDFQVLSRGQALGIVSEILPIVRGQTEAVSPIATEVSRFVELQVALGQSADAAIDSAFKFAKAGEQAGRFTDAAGNIDPNGISNFFQTLRQGAAQIGKEFTPELVQGVTKLLRTSKFALNNEGLLTALFLAEEQGTTAGVGINQLIKQLSGERIQKKQLANLEALGLITTTEVETGRVGADRTFEREAKGSVNDELLRENILQFVIQEVFPRAKAAGFDLTKETDAARFAGTVTSDRTATDALTALILRANEIQSQVQIALANQAATAANTQKVIDESLLVAGQSALSQFNGLLGEAGNAFKGVLIPALNTTAGILQSLGSFISGPEGEGSPTRAAATALGVGAAGFGLVKGGGALLNFFNPLTASATALNGSAAALNAAAAALTRSAAAGAVPNATGRGAAATGAAAGLATGATATRGLGIVSFLKNALGVTAIAAGAKLALDEARETEQGKALEQQALLPFLRELFAAQAPAREAANKMQEESQRAAATAITQSLIEDRATRMRPEDMRQVQQIQADSILIKNLSALERSDREKAAARAISTDRSITEDRAARFTPADARQVQQIQADNILVKNLSAIERADSERAGFKADETLAAPGGTFQMFLDGMESSVSQGAATFDQTFAAGGVTVGQGLTAAAPVAGTAIGTNAAAAMNPVAIGQAIGAAAAAAISNAAANIRVNVQNPASFGPVNTGQTTPVE